MQTPPEKGGRYSYHTRRRKLKASGRDGLEGEWKEETLNQDEPSALRIEGGKLVFTGEETALYEDTVELAGGRYRFSV